MFEWQQQKPRGYCPSSLPLPSTPTRNRSPLR